MIESPSARWEGHHLFLGPIGEARTGVVAWAEREIDRGSKLLYAGCAFAGIDELVAVLAEEGLEAEAAAAAGRLEVVDRDRFYSASGYPELLQQARRQGFPGVCSLSAPAAARGVLDDAAFGRFERLLEEACRNPDVSAVCCYDLTADGGTGLRRGVARHTSTWTGRMLHAHSPQLGRLRLVGEIDRSNEEFFAEVCVVAVARAGPVLLLDCGELSFVSVGGWRVLHEATAGLRAEGGRVRLTGLSKLTTRTLAMLGYERAFELGSGR